MPTYNRRTFLGQAIAYFLRQDYVNKELIIVDDGTDAISDLGPVDERICYVRLPDRKTIGTKRNLACEEARGSIIAHWDDDDWHASDRLSHQVEALLREDKDICGTSTQLFYDVDSGRAWQYVFPAERGLWLAGSTLCYTRTFWAGNHFADINVSEDGRFVRSSQVGHLASLSDATFHVGIIHRDNVSPKETNGPYWRPYSVEQIQRLLGSDWDFYHARQAGMTTDVKLANLAR